MQYSSVGRVCAVIPCVGDEGAGARASHVELREVVPMTVRPMGHLFNLFFVFVIEHREKSVQDFFWGGGLEVLGIEPRASYMLGKYSITELYP